MHGILRIFYFMVNEFNDHNQFKKDIRKLRYDSFIRNFTPEFKNIYLLADIIEYGFELNKNSGVQNAF